eukprot:gnl/MRDRNA2_/MRDRNA2_79794_c0_seq1.p1 gnl/MRDRNA2_/MRDRNA2_79794_c0~~gnl/MRDRNA2_/MRDRNA2_79794_c0_seq1.p1  ORF type:complete len:225 (-),score=36.69 gnl/MRDRNA2_/MRDRNA2_79794_c0_seq1:70-744(-)
MSAMLKNFTLLAFAAQAHMMPSKFKEQSAELSDTTDIPDIQGNLMNRALMVSGPQSTNLDHTIHGKEKHLSMCCSCYESDTSVARAHPWDKKEYWGRIGGAILDLIFFDKHKKDGKPSFQKKRKRWKGKRGRRPNAYIRGHAEVVANQTHRKKKERTNEVFGKACLEGACSPCNWLVAQDFLHIISMPILALFGFLLGGGVTFVVLHARRRISTSAKQPLLTAC